MDMDRRSAAPGRVAESRPLNNLQRFESDRSSLQEIKEQGRLLLIPPMGRNAEVVQPLCGRGNPCRSLAHAGP